MSLSPELLWPILSLIVLAGIAWGAIQYKTRDKSLDPVSEKATKALWDDPGPEPMKGDLPPLGEETSPSGEQRSDRTGR